MVIIMTRFIKEKLVWIIIVVLILFGAVCFLTVGNYYHNIRKAAADFVMLKESAAFHISENAMPEKEESTEALSGMKHSGMKLPDVNILYGQNQDTAGWLTIPDTRLDYPVMHTPQEPEYYLNRNFNREYSKSGVPFADANCPADMDADNMIIYGHNMKNGSMFADLLKYEKKEYWKEHKDIIFFTLFYERTYEIIGAMFVDAESEEAVKSVYSIEFGNKDGFDSYLEFIKKGFLYDTEANVEYGDRLLTLSTCSYQVRDGRFVVVAKEKIRVNKNGAVG